jgi:sarcosine oxidase, subunit beta
MKISPDVVVIGAGVVGASIAHHLTARTAGTRVLLLDAAAGPGAGSTGRATGGFRAQFGSPVNVRLSLLAREKLLRFREETGVDPGFEQAGYLFVAGDPVQLDALAAALRVQHENGLAEARLVDADEVRRINPAVHGPIAGGTFCPSDGFLRPVRILRGYLDSALRHGAEVRFGTRVYGVRVERGRAAAVLTECGEIPAGVVVNAAGAHAAKVAVADLPPLPVRPLRRQVAPTVPTAVLPREMPMTIFLDDGFHLRVRDGRVLLLWPDQPPEEEAHHARVSDAWVAEVTARARSRIPRLRSVPVDRGACWAGLYEMSPDGHALLGAVPGIVNLFCAVGSSGHGVMHAPALGQLLAEQILDGGAPTLDVSPLRPGRFAEAAPVIGSPLL